VNDETRRVLDLLAQGKITVDEADQLLRAINAPPPPQEAAASPKPRYLRISVHKPANDRRPEKDVMIRVPIGIIKSGMRLGAVIPGFAGDQVMAKLRERGLDLDFSTLDSTKIEAMFAALGDQNIEIDSGMAQVRITCE